MQGNPARVVTSRMPPPRPLTFRRVAGFAAALLAGTPHVHAQPDIAASESPAAEGAVNQVQPPEPIATPLEYPAGETRSAVVMLELAVDVEGHVFEVRLIAGEPPFSDAALIAARSWSFSPALRNGKPVAARIRYSVNYQPPVSGEEEVPPEPAAVVTPGVAARPAQKPLEVVVQGQRAKRPHPGSVTLTREETRSIPGTFGDPLRAVEAQPGVVPIVSGLPSFFVRGAPPANVGFFIDGVDVPLLYHAFFGPSVIHPGLIENVELYSSAPPVQYGRFAGPVVAATLRPLAHRWNGEASVRLIDAGALVEAPFGGCEGEDLPGCSRGSVRVGGRYSYTGLILSLLGDAKLDYWDYQGNASYALGRRDTVSVLAFGAYDFFEAGGTGQQGGGEVSFHRVDLRWDHATARTRIRVAVTGGYDSTGGVEEATSFVSNRSVRLRSELETDLSEVVTLHAGIDGRLDDFKLDTDPALLNFADYSRLFPARVEQNAGVYLSTELRPTRNITLVPGIRADLYRDRGVVATGVDPRISADFRVSERVSLQHSFGVAHQRPNFVPNIPAAQVADLEGGLQQALLWSSGMKLKLPSDFFAMVNVFRAGYFNALDPLGGKRDFGIDRTVIERRSTISSAGLELQIRRSLVGQLGGFVAYTLSHTEESTGREEAVSGFDRPHVIQAALGYDFPSGLSLGTRAVFYSGIPELNFEGTPHFTADRRGRPYFRADFRVAKRFRLSGSYWWGLTAEMLNATATTEVVRLDCGRRCAQRVAGPVILPSIGVEGGF
jgi:hypothetical protein